MNFFFQRKLKAQLRKETVPVRPEFFVTLKKAAVDAAEEDQRPSFVMTMKLYKRIFTFATIPLGMAIVLAATQFANYLTPSARTVFNIPEVLAESIQNTFELGNTTDFIHQRLAFYFGSDTSTLNLETWRYEDNFRTSFRPETENDFFKGWEHLQSDTQSCSYTSFSASSSIEEINRYVPRVECVQDVDAHYPPLVSGSLELIDVHVEGISAVEAEGEVDAYLVWSSSIALDPEVLFSFYRSGYAEGNGAAYEVSVQESEGAPYVYRAPLFIPEVGNRGPLQDADGSMQFVQVRSGGNMSLVFDVDLLNYTVQSLSTDQLANAQQEYIQALRDLAREVNSPEERYDDFFGVALALRDQLEDLIPLSETDELYQGQQATRVKYALPDELTSQEEYIDIAQIEFVVDVQNKKILEYATFDSTGESVQQVSVEVSEVVTNVDPNVFFSVDQWKKDIGVE